MTMGKRADRGGSAKGTRVERVCDPSRFAELAVRVGCQSRGVQASLRPLRASYGGAQRALVLFGPLQVGRASAEEPLNRGDVRAAARAAAAQVRMRRFDTPTSPSDHRVMHFPENDHWRA